MDVIKFLLLCLLVNFSYADILGYYILEKDKNNKEVIVEIIKHNDKYYAYALGYSDKSFGKYKNLIFMWDLKKINENHFDYGKILNIDNNKTYDIKVIKNVDHLDIKVKVVFGPTLKWRKISNDEFDLYGFKKPDINALLSDFIKDK